MLDNLENKEIQWIWGTFSAIPKKYKQEEILKYNLPGVENIDKKEIKIQHPLAEIEIIAYDSTFVQLIAKDKTIVLNPYEFTQKLIRYLYDLPNVRIYENTNIVDVNPGAIDGVEAKTNNDFLILASNVIFSSGFETLKYMDKTPVELYRNFTIVSGKKDELKNLDHKFVAKDMQEPCHYIRFTDTGRVICSGEDVKLTDKFNDTKYLNNVAKDKYKKLYSYIQKTLPMSQNLSVDYAFNSIIADTKDNLPIIDEMPGMPNCFCNLGFGVNGILYSAIGGNILKDAIKGFYTKDMNLFKIIR